MSEPNDPGASTDYLDTLGDPLACARAIVEAATPGPWEIEREELSRDFSDEEQELAFPREVGPIVYWEHASDDANRVEADARHIALMGPRVAARLLAVAEAAESLTLAHARGDDAQAASATGAVMGTLHDLRTALRVHLEGES